MKLRNTKEQMVRIRRPDKRVNIELGPLEVMEIDLKTRQAITPFLVDFGLKIEADDEDFHPNATLPKNIQSTVEEPLHARQPVDEDEPTDAEMEGLFFEKTVEETESATNEEPGTTTESSSGGDDVDDAPVGDTDTQALEELYTTVAKGTTEDLPAEERGLLIPDSCPYTEPELMTKTKSELWEIAENLGLSSEGTKKALVARIFSFYVDN